MNLTEALTAARNSGCPCVAVTTTDEPATARTVAQVYGSEGAPVLAHDIVRGALPANEPAGMVIAQMTAGQDPISVTQQPTDLLTLALKLPDNGTIIMYGAHRWTTEGAPVQALCNCRDNHKARGCTIVLLGPLFALPPELAQDVLQLDDPPPDEQTRTAIVISLHEDAGAPAPGPEALTTAARATRGLSAYAAEQAVALSLRQDTGMDMPALWLRWRAAINGVPGLKVDTSGSTLDDIGGLAELKNFARKLMSGKRPPAAIVRIEEIEKAMAGSGAGGGGDTSGVSQSILAALLTFMEEEQASGLVAYGPPGSGKSLSSVALGSAGNVPTITLDLNALKGSLVGQSEANTRRALATIKALAGAGTFWIASCNSDAALPPELKRRFRYGTWFFDLPDATERASIWQIHLARHPDVDKTTPHPNDDGWTGAEIRTCVELADDLRITTDEAARWIMPVSKTAAEQINKMRGAAAGRYLSASYAGPYRLPSNATAPDPSAVARKFNFTPAKKE